MKHAGSKPHEDGKVSGRFVDPQSALRRQYILAITAYQGRIAALMRQGLGEWAAIRATPPIDFAPFVDLCCGARGKRTGLPCPQRGLFANGRCRWHGGMSTGPKSAEGKARSALNGSIGRHSRRSNPKT